MKVGQLIVVLLVAVAFALVFSGIANAVSDLGGFAVAIVGSIGFACLTGAMRLIGPNNSR
jgi:hypothetical protein